VVRFVRDRRGYKNDVNGKPGRFGMSGMVGTNVVLGDQETGTSWQQATGEAIEGPLKGRRLTMVTFIHTTWGEWRAEHPRALIMLPAPGREESYAHYKCWLQRPSASAVRSAKISAAHASTRSLVSKRVVLIRPTRSTS